ncbi:MAG: hemolysin family protein [Candidatus Gracilibacteria bacterium]|nr:hemolysin family protein [Candidatus Gracilibacteria bacterium]
MQTEIILFLILLVLSGFFSGIEIALFSLSKIQIRKMVDNKRNGAETLIKLRSNPERLLATILVGNNVVNIGAAGLATVIGTHYFASEGVGIATGVTTLLVLIFGEITPKAVFNVFAEPLALFFAKPLRLIQIVFSPIVFFLDKLTKLILRMFGAKSRKKRTSEIDVKLMAEMAVEEGGIDEEERKFIEKAFMFNDIQVGDVMTPLNEVVSLSSTSTVKKAIEIVLESSFSRIPVYSKHRDNITGVVFMRDLMLLSQQGKASGRLKDIQKKPIFVPMQKHIDELFRDLQRKRIHIAIVLGEFGEVVGMVTMEDLLEELVGEIHDESDEVQVPIKRINKYTVDVDASVDIDDLNEFFKTKLPNNDYLTLNGLLVEQFQRIPKANDRITAFGLDFTVLSATDKKIEMLRVSKKV